MFSRYTMTKLLPGSCVVFKVVTRVLFSDSYGVLGGCYKCNFNIGKL